MKRQRPELPEESQRIPRLPGGRAEPHTRATGVLPFLSFVSGLVTVFFQFPEGQTFTNKSKRFVYLAAYSIFPCPKTSQTWHIQKWIPCLPFSPLALLPGSPISVNGNPIVKLLRPKMMEPSSTSLFLSHATSNPSANPTGSSFKTYPEFKHFSLFSFLLWVQAIHSSCLEYSSSFLTSFLLSTLDHCNLFST